MKNGICGRGGIGRRARLRIWCLRRGGSRPLARTSGEAPRQTRDYMLVPSFFFYARVPCRLTAINSSGKTHSNSDVVKEAPRQTRDYMLVPSFFFYARVPCRLTAINSSGKTHSNFNVVKEAPRQARVYMLVPSFFFYAGIKHTKIFPNFK